MKPFVKWAGGKARLIKVIEQHLPHNFDQLKDLTYVEPFVGGGAMLFHMLQKHSNIHRAIINDINADLIGAYKQIRQDPEALIKLLKEISAEYLSSEDIMTRQEIYYRMRNEFNAMTSEDALRIPYFLFLNQTCFNGLYRVNSSGRFNVPHGRYKSPTIINEQNLLQVHTALQQVEIQQGDFAQVVGLANGKNVFFYFDPPYRPLKSDMTMFTQYNQEKFSDKSQERLKGICDKISKAGWYFMVSNSDSYENEKPYFDHLYSGYCIHRFSVSRSINVYSAADRRPKEILITNY